MAYTLKQLTMAYTAVHDGIAPDAQTLSQLTLMTNPSFTDQQVLSYILNSADGGTALAALSYQFFTGKSPTQAGLDYLVNSTANPTDLNDPYYARFNTENRYINFAANLGVQGEGAAAFSTKYGALSFADYVASIYESIIGKAYATTAGIDPAKAIADIVSRQAAILATAQSAGMITPNMTQAQIDLAVKAAAAGYLLGEAIKADVGIYAGAANNFMIALATGTATYNTDITTTYAPTPGDGSHGTGHPVDTIPTTLPGAEPPPPPPPPPEPDPEALSLALTTGVDHATGGDLDDTITGTNLTFNATDVIDGGAGNDSLTLSVGSGGVYALPAATVSNVETATITGARAFNGDTRTWTGLTQLNVTSVGGSGAGFLVLGSNTNLSLTSTGVGADNVILEGGKALTLTLSGVTTAVTTIGGSIAPTGAIVVHVDSSFVGATGDITVVGGTSVNVAQTASNAVNSAHQNAAVEIDGRTTTTSVTVTAPAAAATTVSTAGITANNVTIIDVYAGSATEAGAITTVSADSFTILRVNDTAMTSLTVAHGSGHILIDNSGLNTPTNTTLNLNIDGQTAGFLDDADVYTTLNVTTGATASILTNITFDVLTTLTLAGASGLKLNSTTGLTHLHTVTISGAAGLDADLSGVTVTSVSAAASSGANTVTIDGSKATYAGGSGVDTVTLTTNLVSEAISGGTGSLDVLSMDANQAATASGSGVFAGLVTGFERLTLTGATNQLIFLDDLGGYHYVTTSGGNGLTLNGMASGDTLELTGNGTSYSIGGGVFGNVSDTFNIKLSSVAAIAAASTGVNISGVETVNIAVADTGATPTGAFNDSLKVVDGDEQTINITGNAGLTLTAAGTALTAVDASGLTLGGFTWTSGALTQAVTVKGSAAGANIINVSAATNTLAYTGGTGADTITVSGHANTVDVGSGAVDIVKLGSANSAAAFTTVTGMAAGDKIDFVGLTSSQATLGAAAGGATLDDAASGDGLATPHVSWFVSGGATYIVLDHSAATTFQDGVDYVIKLTGVYDLSGATTSGSVVTLA